MTNRNCPPLLYELFYDLHHKCLSVWRGISGVVSIHVTYHLFRSGETPATFFLLLSATGSAEPFQRTLCRLPDLKQSNSNVSSDHISDYSSCRGQNSGWKALVNTTSL